MKSLMVGLALLIITTVTWACVHINIADGDVDDSNTVTGIEIEKETESEKGDN